MQPPAQRRSPPLGGPAGLILCLTVLAVLVAAAGTIGGIAILVSCAAAGAAPGRDAMVAEGVACLLGGLGLAGALWALSWIVRYQFESSVTQRRLLSLLTGVEPLPTPPPPAPSPRPPAAAPRDGPRREEELLAAVRELSANLLFTPEERQVKRRRQQEDLGNRLVQEVRDATVRGDFARGRELLQRLADEFPADARAGELRAALEASRSAAAEEEIATAQRRSQDLMALGKFSDARDVAQHLASRHPGEERAGELLASVAREEGAFAGEQKRRMYAELERHAGDRRWRSALAAARAFLEKFPDSPEGQAVSAQIATLEDNARIEEVRDLRDRLRECIERRRYEEALQIAREVIRRFPGTAAAGELAPQLPRLEELARGGGGGPA